MRTASDAFLAEKDAVLKVTSGRLARLVALLDQPRSPGDDILLRAEIEAATREAFAAAVAASAYQRRMAAHSAALEYRGLARGSEGSPR
jgi:hypothetical protein